MTRTTNAGAYALASTLAVAMLVLPGLASASQMDYHHSRGNDITISNSNGAFVMNSTSASANTGANEAGGSTGGNGGNGGAITNSGDDVSGSTTGRGGNGGNGSLGGEVRTGNATAVAETSNLVNSNDTRVNACGCEESNVDDIRIYNHNHAFVGNLTGASANSGANAADGSRGGNAGAGGSINNTQGGDDVTESTTGMGGNGGHGGSGGLVITGHADSYAGTINVVNRNVTRIVR